MSSCLKEKPSVMTKMQQSYWETRRNLNNLLGTRDDDCLISNDIQVDTRIELLRAADNHFNALMAVLIQYNKALNYVITVEEGLASALMEFSIKDNTKAGRLMASSGKVISKAANRRGPLKVLLMKLFQEVQTFQLKATVDVLEGVARMERIRRAYRSGLLWMKNESQSLDPEVSRKVKKFKKVQEHIRILKVRFDRSKVETMQKIDLYLFSRCNLFSQNLEPYRKTFCKMSKNFMLLAKAAMHSLPSNPTYKFEALKQLNECSKLPKVCDDTKQNEMNQTSKKVIKSVLKITEEKSQDANSAQLIEPDDLLSENDVKNVVEKRVRFHDSAQQDEQETNDEPVLINLNDDTDNIFLKELSINETGIFSGMYSKDLLSLSVEAFEKGDHLQDNEMKNGFEEAFEECIGLFDTLEDGSPQGDNSELQFWCLLESFGNVKDTNSETIEESPKSIADSNQNRSDQSAHWEDLLIEFDPYTNSIWMNTKCDVNETC